MKKDLGQTGDYRITKCIVIITIDWYSALKWVWKEERKVALYAFGGGSSRNRGHPRTKSKLLSRIGSPWTIKDGAGKGPTITEGGIMRNYGKGIARSEAWKTCRL